MSAKLLFAKAGALVAPVEPHFLPEQAGTDTDLNLVHDGTPCITVDSVIAVIQKKESCITIVNEYGAGAILALIDKAMSQGVNIE
ncbi:hypothetical protein GCM10027295_40320 [Pseudaeromonas pectinilytica]